MKSFKAVGSKIDVVITDRNLTDKTDIKELTNKSCEANLSSTTDATCGDVVVTGFLCQINESVPVKP